MRAHRDDIDTPEKRIAALTRLANAVFHGNVDVDKCVLDKRSASNGTGNLSVRDFISKGATEFRTIERNYLHSSIANIPLSGFLEDYKRFMPNTDLDYVKFMVKECHGEKYDKILNANKLETAEERLETLRALYEAHGADGIDQPSDNFSFDKETRVEEFYYRDISAGQHIKRPDHAAEASYVGFMNAVCDLFLNQAKQKDADLLAWFYKNLLEPDPGHFKFAAE